MIQRTINTFENQIHGKAPRKNDITNKTDDYHTDDTWSSDRLDFMDYGPKNNRGYRYVLVVFDIFNKYGRIVPLKTKMLK